MECRVTRDTKNKLTVIEETPHYYAALEVDVIDRRESDVKPETMMMYFEVEDRNICDAYAKMLDILKNLGYHLCGQGALEIRETPNDALDRYNFGLPINNK